MSDLTNDRKIEHIRIVSEMSDVDRNKLYFDQIRLTHRALPELNLKDVDTSCEFMGKKLSFPLLISSMTGGDHEVVRTINRRLAKAAEAKGVAMGVGSQRVMFTHPPAQDSFALRQYAPNALLFANIGAVQLNLGFGIEECKQACDIIEADGLFFHLNPLQEAVQKDGDTDFAGLAKKIGQITSELPCPVIAKEVGAGISRADAILLKENGVHYIDTAGCGGTSWSHVEHLRKDPVDKDALGIAFQDWGIPTPAALQALHDIEDITLIASGGLRNGMDMVKGMVLGASLCGMARPFLEAALESDEAVIQLIERLHQEFATAQFLLGVAKASDLINNRLLLLS